MRWTYILPRAILVGLVWAFFQYGFDPLVRQGMIYSGQRAARAKVEVAGLTTTFFSPSLSASNIAVADRKHPGTNLVEFTDLRGNVELHPLLKKSFIVEEATVSGLKWGTKRADSGLLPGEEPDLSTDNDSEMLDKVKQELLSRGKDWLAGLADRAKLDFDPNQFETVRLGKELEERWPKEFGNYDAALDELKARIEELRKSVKVKGGNELEKIERYGKAAQEAEQVLRELEQFRVKIGQTMKQAEEDLQALNEAKGQDFKKIKEKADLLHLNPDEVTELLLGPELTNRLETTISWIKFLRERIQLATDEPKPERMRGETIFFSRKEELPLLLIRLLNVDGEGEFSGERLKFKGTVSGVTTNPKIHNKPIVIRLEGSGVDFSPAHSDSASPLTLAAHSSSKLDESNAVLANNNDPQKPAADALSVQLKAVFDYTKAIPEHQLVLSYKEPRPDHKEIGKPESIQLAMASRATQCLADIKMLGDDIDGRINFQQVLESITAKLGTKRFKGDNNVLAVVQDVVSSIRKIDADMKLDGTILKPKFQLRSNLGADLSGGINTAFARQLEEGRRMMLVRFDQEAAKRSEKLTQLYDEQLEKLTGKLQLHKGEVHEIAQAFGLKLPGKLDLKKITNGLPIDINKPIDLSKPIDMKAIGKSLPKLNKNLPDLTTMPELNTLPKFGTQPQSNPVLPQLPRIGKRPTGTPNDVNQPTETTETGIPDLSALPGLENNKSAKQATDAIRQASEVQQTLDGLGLFGKKKKLPASKVVKPAINESSAPATPKSNEAKSTTEPKSKD